MEPSLKQTPPTPSAPVPSLPPENTHKAPYLVLGVVLALILIGGSVFALWEPTFFRVAENSLSSTTSENTYDQSNNVSVPGDDSVRYFSTKANVDKTKLTPVSDYYAKDSDHAYFVGYDGKTYYVLDDADPATFHQYSKDHPNVALDANHVYVSNRELVGVDITTFVVLNENYAKDKNTFYSICIGEECDFGVVSNIDANTYTLLSGSSYYGKDTNRYYYGQVPMVGLATSTFTIINDYYAKDKNQVYRGANPIEGADVATFVPIQGYGGWYAKDANHVYIRGYLEKDISPQGFSVINQIYSKDTHIVYYFNGVDESEVIEGADPATFAPLTTASPSYGSYSGLPESLWSKDAHHVYFSGSVLPNADPDTFVVLNGRYGKDVTHAYIMDAILPNVDVTSFVGLQEDIWYAKDKNHVWTGSKIIQGADPATFAVVSPDQSCGTNCMYRAYDKNHKYDYNGNIVQ